LDTIVAIYIAKILSINFDSKENELNSENKSKESKTENKKPKGFIIDNFYLIEMIYLFNPLSIISCVGMQLKIVYNFLFFSLISYLDIDHEIRKNTSFPKITLASLFIVINLLCNPATAFIIIFFYFRNFYLATFLQKLKLFFAFLLSLSFVAGCLYVFFDVNEFYGVMTQYYNYFFVKDSLPNIGLMWGLFPEVF